MRRPRLPRPLGRFGAGRGLGAPALFALAGTAAGASMYLILGVVAGKALGLTPAVFLLAGAFFLLAMVSYIEANSLHPERGGASSFARYAFNELWSFVAGWAIVLDFLIVMALGAYSISHYLAVFWSGTGEPAGEILIAAAAIAFVAWWNVRGISAERLGPLVWLTLANILLAAVVVVGGVATVFDPSRITDSIQLGSAPTWDDAIFALVVATVAVTGVESASGVAGEFRVGRRGLRRAVTVGTVGVILGFVGVSAVALMAVPVSGGSTELGGRFIDAPMIGVVSAYEPSWLVDGLRYAVGAVAALVLLQVVNASMLGLSRLSYSLAVNRQIPSATGRLHPRYATPYVAIPIAAVLAIGLSAFRDIELLAASFAYGAMLALTIAHVSVIVLRYREPDRARAFEIPLSVRVRGGLLPLPAVVGALWSFAAWVSVLVLHEEARVIGSAWMVIGVSLYVIYRKTQGKSLQQRFTIPAEALGETPEAQYGSILVPVSGSQLDDDIVGTAGRLAAEDRDKGEGGPVIEALYVVEMPMSLPLTARVPPERIAEARQALARAKEVGEEYEGVEVATATVRARSSGAAIVDEARRRGVEAIVLAAEQPSRVRGGAALGGQSRPADRSVGEMTRYVIEKAPCRVILTAAPASEDGIREGVAP